MNILNDVIPGRNKPMYQTLLKVTDHVSYNKDVPADSVTRMKNRYGNKILK